MEISSENLRNLSPKVPFRGLFSLQEHQSILANLVGFPMPISNVIFPDVFRGYRNF